MRQMRIFAIAIVYLITGCSGSGGFNDGIKLGKKSENKDEDTKAGEDLGTEKEDDDTADQPIQITGTYLTCGETESSETNAVFGCRVANKKNGSTVALNRLAFDWTFDYEILNGAAGKVTVKKSKQLPFQILFEFEASSNIELKALLAATKIILDMTYLPGVNPVGSGPAFEGLIATFIPQTQQESTSGTQSALDSNIVGTQPTLSNQTPVTETPATQPTQPAQQPATVPNRPEDGSSTSTVVQNPVAPEMQTTPAAVNPAQPEAATKPTVAIDPKDPVAFFTLVKGADGSLTLQAYFDQISGLSDPIFTGTKNLSYAGGVPYTDGTAMVMLTTPMTVSVKKGDKTCTGNGTIGAGVISIPLACK
jgi:hypothetical protein